MQMYQLKLFGGKMHKDQVRRFVFDRPAKKVHRQIDNLGWSVNERYDDMGSGYCSPVSFHTSGQGHCWLFEITSL